MSYMRGANYIWSDGHRLHLWIADGGDEWLGGWRAGRANPDVSHVSASPPFGVSIAEETMDEFVVMRLAELLKEGGAAEALLRATTLHRGNLGCSGLLESASWLLPCIQAMQSPDKST